MPNSFREAVPVLTTDLEAEDFLKQDLSALDFSQFKPTRLETLPDSAQEPANSALTEKP